MAALNLYSGNFLVNIKATIGYIQVSKQAFRSRNIPKIYQYSPLEQESPF